jgi:hypothetical protein
MGRHSRALAAALFTLLLAATTPSTAFAYLDGGTGSLIFQWVIAGAVAGGFILKLYWGRIRKFFGPKNPPREDA